jgi:integrase
MGFPILSWEDMTSCREANEFLQYYLSRGTVESKNSWAAIGRALYDYFGFLEGNELNWKDVDRGERKNLVAGYRDYCFDVAKLSRNTIRNRLVYICEFYKHAAQEKWINKLPYSFEMRNFVGDGGFLAHLSRNVGKREVRSVMPRKHKHIVKFLTIEEANRLLKAAENTHHQMIIKLALKTGLRREELATFPAAYVFDPDKTNSRARNVKVLLNPEDGNGMRTKGMKTRKILMPRETMKALHRYLVHHRGARASLTSNQHPQLFLNQDGKPWAQNGKGIEAMVRKIGRKIGIETHPHMLRHTYATHTLVTLQRHRHDNGIEPLVFLQQQLGHASIRSVMIYLHIVNELADDAVLAYDQELNELGEEKL